MARARTSPPAISLPIEGEDITTRVNRRESAEQLFVSQCRSYRLPRFETQLMFAKEELGRRWLFDVAFPDYKLAIEIEGIVVQNVLVAVLSKTGTIVGHERKTFVMGRHATAKGFREDCEKYASAAQLGWCVVRFEQTQIKSTYAIQMTMRALAARGWGGPT